MGRRAKYLLVRLDNGEVLVIHLGMSGRITVVEGRKIGDLDPAPMTMWSSKWTDAIVWFSTTPGDSA